MTNFREILIEFNQLGLEFVIIGGVVARVHGSTYATDDLAVCYARTEENLLKIAGWLQRHHASLRGAPSDLPFSPDVQTLRAGLNFTFATDVGSIDFLGEVQPIGFYPDLVKHAIIVEVYGTQCRIVDLDTLIRIKKKIGRAKDNAIALELEAIKELLEKKQTNSPTS